MGAIYYDDKLYSGAIDNVVACTLAEYNTLTPAEKNNGRIYMITDQNVNGLNTVDLRYSNLISKLSSTNIQDAIDEIVNIINQMDNRTSHIGMVIHSTVLDTEIKVKELYGGKKWIQHTGYFLRGASSNVTSNSAIKDGGEDNHVLTITEIPSHTHTLHTKALATPGTNYEEYRSGSNGGGTWKDNAMSYTGGSQAHNNIPSYKSVYIWERTE